MDTTEAQYILNKKLGKTVKIKEVALLGAGYHSNGYKVSVEGSKSYFIKQIKSHDLGFEFPERKVMSLLVSHGMMRRTTISPRSLGIAIKNEAVEFLPEITENTEIYHIQEFGGEGKSYLEMLKEKQDKKEVDKKDRVEVDRIIEFIVKIHKVKHPSTDKKRLNSIYNDCLRSVIGNPEYLLQLLHAIPEDSPLLSPKQQGDFMALMLENMHYFKDGGDRLVALHGDFWGANVFFKNDGSIFVIDYSRMPWGDPGFDVGFWMSGYVLRYHMGNKNYFKKLGQYFLEAYIKKTGDKKITQTLIYSLGLVSAMYASPVWVPGIDDDVRKSFFEHVCNTLKKKEFYW